MIDATKQDLLDNITGKFGLLFSYTTVVDEDVIAAAGKYSISFKHLNLDIFQKKSIKK